MAYNKAYLEKLDKELKLVPLTYDFSFKRMFATKKNGDYLLLKIFLISVLKLDMDPYNSNIEVLCTELPKENKFEYKKTLDINVRLNDYVHLDIEMNRTRYETVKVRNSLYESKLFSMVFGSGAKNKNFLENYIYQLNLNNYEKIDKQEYIKDVEGEEILAWVSTKTHKIHLENRVTILKYLDYYKNLYYNEPNKCGLDSLWLALLTSTSFKELGEYLEKLLPEYLKDEFIKEAINMSRDDFILHAWEEEKMEDLKKVEFERYYEKKYENALEEGLKEGLKEGHEQGLKQGIEQGLEKGIEQGIEKGIEQGKEETIKETIKSMLKEQISYDTISRITKKSIKYIKEIESSNN